MKKNIFKMVFAVLLMGMLSVVQASEDLDQVWREREERAFQELQQNTRREMDAYRKGLEDGKAAGEKLISSAQAAMASIDSGSKFDKNVANRWESLLMQERGHHERILQAEQAENLTLRDALTNLQERMGPLTTELNLLRDALKEERVLRKRLEAAAIQAQNDSGMVAGVQKVEIDERDGEIEALRMQVSDLERQLANCQTGGNTLAHEFGEIGILAGPAADRAVLNRLQEQRALVKRLLTQTREQAFDPETLTVLQNLEAQRQQKTEALNARRSSVTVQPVSRPSGSEASNPELSMAVAALKAVGGYGRDWWNNRGAITLEQEINNLTDKITQLQKSSETATALSRVLDALEKEEAQQ